jgi:hypothetical protein
MPSHNALPRPFRHPSVHPLYNTRSQLPATNDWVKYTLGPMSTLPASPRKIVRACTPLSVMTDEQTGLSRQSICIVHVPFKRKDTRRPAARPDVAGHAPQASPASNHNDNPPRLQAPMLAACITETAGLHVYMLPAIDELRRVQCGTTACIAQASMPDDGDNPSSMPFMYITPTGLACNHQADTHAMSLPQTCLCSKGIMLHQGLGQRTGTCTEAGCSEHNMLRLTTALPVQHGAMHR